MYVTLLLFEISILKGPDHLLIELSELEKHSLVGMLQVWPPTIISASLVNEHIGAGSASPMGTFLAHFPPKAKLSLAFPI